MVELSPVRLEDLPVHRRDILLWRSALRFDYAELDEIVHERSLRPCRWEWPVTPVGERVATLGDDGRYHLCIDGQPLCGDRPPEGGTLVGRYQHTQSCTWWTSTTRYRVHAPPRSWDWNGGRRMVAWTVALTTATRVPVLVPPHERCPVHHALQGWPHHENRSTAMGRVRAALVDAFGHDCHICRGCPGVMIDHDHFTGLVRGLLCGPCNTHVESCPHLHGCPFGDYLNEPPAAPLQLRYPELRRALRGERRKIDHLGFDPFIHLRTPQA